MKVGDKVESGKSYPIGTRFFHNYDGSIRPKHIFELVSKDRKYALKDLTQGDYFGPDCWLSLEYGKAIVSRIIYSDLIITHLPNQETNTMTQSRTIPTKEQVLKAARKSYQIKEVLEILFPEYFNVDKHDVLQNFGKYVHIGPFPGGRGSFDNDLLSMEPTLAKAIYFKNIGHIKDANSPTDWVSIHMNTDSIVEVLQEVVKFLEED